MAKNSKKRIDIVYSTNPDFHYEEETDGELETLPPSQQTLHILIDKKQRAGKEVTLIQNFRGTEADLQALGKILKNKCGTGGSVKDGEIIVQGSVRDRVTALLNDMGYKTKRVGG